MIKTLLMEKFLTLCYVENIVMLICMASCKLEDSNDFNTEFNLLWRWQEMALLEELKYIVLNTQYFKADFLIKNVFHFFLYSFFFISHAPIFCLFLFCVDFFSHCGNSIKFQEFGRQIQMSLFEILFILTQCVAYLPMIIM